MNFLHVVLVALIQGATEFLPVSSSGHLILLPTLSGLPDQGAIIDVFAHVGTLIAVLLYFRHEAVLLWSGIGDILTGRMRTVNARFFFLLAFATLPVMIAGLALKLADLDTALRSMAVIGWTMLGFGFVLFLADRFGCERKTDRHWGPGAALAMGMAQVLALIPGTSRSGITITAARAIGFDRKSSARLSMVMSIPTILAAGLLTGMDVFPDMRANQVADAFLVALMSCLAALAALHIMMRFLERFSFTPYVIYRIGLGILLLTLSYT